MFFYSQESPHTGVTTPRLYLVAHFPNVHFELQLTEDGWIITTPPGVDWSDPQEPDEVGNQRPNIPRDPWTWYQQQYGIEASQPTPEEVLTYEPPQPEQAPPVTDVDKAIGNFKAARLAAPEALDKLKGTVWAALVAGGMTPDEATAAGVGLVLIHGPLLAAFEAAGGHPVAGQALYAAIASKPSTDALPWLTKGILEVFEAALVPK